MTNTLTIFIIRISEFQGIKFVCTRENLDSVAFDAPDVQTHGHTNLYVPDRQTHGHTELYVPDGQTHRHTKLYVPDGQTHRHTYVLYY